jgi:glycosyltransferase involved in cell wall biosynthesis
VYSRRNKLAKTFENMKPKISIAMATYNGAKYIKEQLTSIAKQDYLPYELVICDDCSIDDTVEIIKKFASTVNFPVHIYRNEQNLGFANNFLKCASLCKGDWIAFSDQDDVWLSKKLSKVRCVIETTQSNELILVCHSADLVNEKLVPIGQRLPDFKYNQLKKRNSHYGFFCIAGFAITFKAKLLSQVDSNLRPRDYDPDEKFQSHDKWIAMLANACGDIAYISESLVLYRRHPLACSGYHDNNSVVNRIKKYDLMGAEYYKFLSDVAKESATSFKEISKSKCEQEMHLQVSARKFGQLAAICKFRMDLYQSKYLFKQMKSLFFILINGGYWGNDFCSSGTWSFLKDVGFLTNTKNEQHNPHPEE